MYSKPYMLHVALSALIGVNWAPIPLYIISGISDSKLSQRLQMDAELTLEKAKKLVRQSEAVQAQQRIVKGPKMENLSAEV